MASRALKTYASFSLVTLPIGLYTATKENEVRFNNLCKEHKTKISRKDTCSICGKTLESKDIIKGYEYNNSYIIITEDDLNKLSTKKDKTVKIDYFTDVKEIRPVFFNKSYFVLPEQGGEKSFELLRQIMQEESVVAVGKVTIRNDESPIVLMPTSDGIVAITLFYHEEIQDIPRDFIHPEISPEELEMGRTLIKSMVEPFDSKRYTDEMQKRKLEMIESKAQNKDFVVPIQEETSATVVNLFDALKKSVEEKQKQTKKKSTRTKTKGA